MKIQVQVNQESQELSAPFTLDNLLVQLSVFKQRGIALAVNESIIPKVSWKQYELQEGDSITLIQATQGG